VLGICALPTTPQKMSTFYVCEIQLEEISKFPSIRVAVLHSSSIEHISHVDRKIVAKSYTRMASGCHSHPIEVVFWMHDSREEMQSELVCLVSSSCASHNSDKTFQNRATHSSLLPKDPKEAVAKPSRYKNTLGFFLTFVLYFFNVLTCNM
jgi:hypothetical protein